MAQSLIGTTETPTCQLLRPHRPRKQPCSSPPSQPGTWEGCFRAHAVHVGPHREDTGRSVREAGKTAAAPTQQALYLPSPWQQSAGDGLRWLQL